MSAISPSAIAIDTMLYSPQYAQQQRDDWGRSAFANLFDMQFQQDEAAPKSPTPISAEQIAPDAVAEGEGDRQDPSQTSATTISLLGTIGQSNESLMIVVGDEPVASEASMPAEGVSAVTTRPNQDVEPAIDSSRSEAVHLVLQSLEPDGDSAASAVMVALGANDHVQVSIRSAALKSRQGLELLSRIRTELSWKGFALERMSINGQIVFPPSSGVAS